MLRTLRYVSTSGYLCELQLTVLEKFFYKRLADAKQAVPEPSQQKIKLKVSSAPEAPAPKITLRVGAKASPVVSANATPAPIANGNAPPGTTTGVPPNRNPFGGSQAASTPVPNVGPLERTRSFSGTLPSPSLAPAATVKREDGTRQSPANAAPAVTPSLGQSQYRSSSQAAAYPPPNTMLPPTTPGLTNGANYGSTTIPAHHNPYASSSPQVKGLAFVESQWRQPGKGKYPARSIEIFLTPTR